jgi:transcriptional regulator with XRE-family HTH domain
MLRLVHPRPAGQEKRASKKPRSRIHYPTPEESDRIRAAIRHLSLAYGGADVLAEVLGVRRKMLGEVLCRKSPGSYALAILLARAARVSVEQILRPGVQEAGKCPVCGRKGAR